MSAGADDAIVAADKDRRVGHNSSLDVARREQVLCQSMAPEVKNKLTGKCGGKVLTKSADRCPRQRQKAF